MSLINFVNHASFLIESGEIGLLSDPWLEGTAFNSGWNLIAQTAFEIKDYARVTHLWFSHEHPDHFHPPTLKNIPEHLRCGITVLYHKTKDGKVLDHCRKMGFSVREMNPGEWIELAPNFRIMCRPYTYFDSWLLIDLDGKRMLNLNDCEVNNAKEADEIFTHTGPVDILASQFSYSCWEGDAKARAAAADHILSRLCTQLQVFQAKLFMPIASLIYFSHEENKHLNDCINSITKTAKFIEANTGARSVVLYPGDEWQFAESHDNTEAMVKYDEDYRTLPRTPHKSPSVTISEIQELAAQYNKRIKDRNNWLFMGILKIIGFLPSVDFHVTDCEQVLKYDAINGLTTSDVPKEQADMALSSDSLAFLFKFDWGLNTLHVNGRFRTDRKGMAKVMSTFAVGLLNNTGRSLGFPLIFDYQFARAAFGKLLIHRKLN
ncbi:MAG: MBL fold metallo-hydrolase [Candidatus Obscuribacterales bacterium]|nr:MBL fold metallo-hydrolase [Candidatus Obscuribacterales bacterium]